MGTPWATEPGVDHPVRCPRGHTIRAYPSSARPTILTALATAVLAVGAIVTAVLAYMDFRKKVRAIERQVSDQKELTTQQANLIRVQSGQLHVLREQLEAQREASALEAEVLGLQAHELRESLQMRKRAAEDRQRVQAARVTAWLELRPSGLGDRASYRAALVHNDSSAPVFDVRVFFHLIQHDGHGWVPVPLGGPPPDQTISLVPPGAKRFVDIPDNIHGRFGDIPVHDSTCAVSIEFTDAAGNRWERDPRGGLSPHM